eukprot:3222267-Rhodomonas_salina.3
MGGRRREGRKVGGREGEREGRCEGGTEGGRHAQREAPVCKLERRYLAMTDRWSSSAGARSVDPTLSVARLGYAFQASLQTRTEAFASRTKSAKHLLEHATSTS